MFEKVELQTSQKSLDMVCESEIYNTFEFNSATFNFSNHPEHGKIILISTPNESFLVRN